MKNKVKRMAALLLVLLMALSLAACGSNPAPNADNTEAAEPAAAPADSGAAQEPEAPEAPADDAVIRLGLVTGDLSNQFFVSMRESAEATAAKYGVELTVIGSTTLQENIQNVEDLIQTGVSAIGICPFDAQGNIPVVEECNAASIPVFTLDEDVEGGDIVAYIGTDNYVGGVLAGEWLAEKLGGAGEVAILEGGAGSYTSNTRKDGFMEGIAGTDIEVVTSIAADWSRDKGMSVMSDIIAGNPNLSAVFALNDDMGAGAMEALKTAGREDVLVIGFNGTAEAIQNVARGDFAATVVQYPEEMGRLYVENALAIVRDGVYPEEEHVHIKPPVGIVDTGSAQKAYKSVTGESYVTAAAGEGDGSGDGVRLGLVTGDLSNQFFVSMRESAEATAAKYGAELTVIGSTTLQENIQNVEDLIQTGVDAVGICPFDAQGNIPVVEECNNADVYVFTLDEDVEGGDIVAYIGTDNYVGGVLAGEWLAEKLGGAGEVAILEGGAGSYTSNTRKDGFMEGIAGTDIEVVTSIAADWSRDKGMSVMSDIIAGNPNLSAVFALNDDMGAGAMEALKTAGREDVLVIGFNGTAEAIQNVASGAFAATVVQYPEDMGRLYVESAIALVKDGTMPGEAHSHIKPAVQLMDATFVQKIMSALTS